MWKFHVLLLGFQKALLSSELWPRRKYLYDYVVLSIVCAPDAEPRIVYRHRTYAYSSGGVPPRKESAAQRHKIMKGYRRLRTIEQIYGFTHCSKIF
ncbi:hypothetical protein EDC04DRAFT_2677477 [Pisolithus marmoratus]|nr:hypothetical protein EDC04DRAFT_2677477 [Pisolithus marmoratus]